MKTKLIFSFGIIPLILATLFLTVASSMDANAQNNTKQVLQQPIKLLIHNKSRTILMKPSRP